MKLIFVEVRDKTRLFAAVASRLSDQHEIGWLVQNHAFNTNLPGTVWEIPYRLPDSGLTEKSFLDGDQVDELIQEIVTLDRFFYRFGHSVPASLTRYIHWVANQVFRVKPDVCIGEIGNFHSLIVSGICKILGIPFVNPISCRYPNERFCFFLYDRMIPLLGSGEQWSDGAINEWLDIIATGKKKPDYMTLSPSRLKKIRYRLKLLGEWLSGERYATQHPLSNLSAKAAIKRHLRRWDQLAESRFREDSIQEDSMKGAALYPLQMQPELNLDVWGREHRDQVALIRLLLDRHPGPLLLKANPKSFFEMSAELIALIDSNPRLIPVPRERSMPQCQPLVDVTYTVTGTVAIESIIKHLPVEILSEDYRRFLGLDRSRITNDAGNDLGSRVLKRLVALSYSGTIGEPLLTPTVMEEKNMRQLTRSFERFLSSLESENPSLTGAKPPQFEVSREPSDGIR